VTTPASTPSKISTLSSTSPASHIAKIPSIRRPS
jgi:hypothetical protein